MERLAFISGVQGLELLPKERDFFKETKPLGLILFARNLASHEQIKRLISDVRNAVTHDQFWVLIDQEGGRVQRLRPPLFPALPAGRRYAELYQQDRQKGLYAALNIGRFMGQRLAQLGINVNCTPVLDAAQEGAHEIISDRSYGTDVETIVSLGRQHAKGHMMSAVLPIIKHIPGHGRAKVDSHHDLPVIDALLDNLRALDFEPFRQLSDLPLAMTAHVIYKAFDAETPVSTSARAIKQLIRDYIGFEGFLMCDDVSMQALKGSIAERVKGVMEAGCDGALHCNGNFQEMMDVANNVPVLQAQAKTRFEASFKHIETLTSFDEKEALALLEENWCQLS